MTKKEIQIIQAFLAGVEHQQQVNLAGLELIAKQVEKLQEISRLDKENQVDVVKTAVLEVLADYNLITYRSRSRDKN